jgi:hypothetical protein
MSNLADSELVWAPQMSNPANSELIRVWWGRPSEGAGRATGPAERGGRPSEGAGRAPRSEAAAGG